MNLILLFDGHTFDMEPQGTTTFLAGLINALPLMAARHFPGVVLDIHCAAASEEGVGTYIKIPYTFHRIHTSFLKRNIFELPRLSRRIQANVVVSQYVRPLRVHKHSAVVIHDLLFVDFPGQFSATYRISRTILFGLSARFSSAVFTVSEYSKERIANIYNIDRTRIGILANAITPRVKNLLQEPTAPPGKRPVHLLYVSRLEQRKRHEWCLRALEDLQREGRDVQLTLIGRGSGNYANELRKLLAQQTNRHGARLNHLEGVSQECLDNIYADTDVFLFPSLGEGFGIPVIEAAAHGVPCVVTGGSALSELRAFYAGLAFEPGDYAQFLSGIKTILDNLDDYKAKAQQNIKKVAEHFSWETTAHRFLESMISLEQ